MNPEPEKRRYAFLMSGGSRWEGEAESIPEAAAKAEKETGLRAGLLVDVTRVERKAK